MPDWPQDLKTMEKYNGVMKHFSLKPRIDPKKYESMHQGKKFIPLNFTIDLELFNSEVFRLKNKFESWGIRKTELSRKGIALTETSEKVVHDYKSGPANWPLDVWNWYHPEKPLADVDFNSVSKYSRQFKSLQEILSTFDGHLGRTNVTWWNSGDYFNTHFDVDLDHPINYRLWLSNYTGNEHKLFMGERSPDRNMTQISNEMEPGRLYLIDTSRYHKGEATVDNVFSLLMTLQPSATNLLEKLLNNA